MKTLLLISTLFFSLSVSADNFVATFIDKYVEDKRPVNNVNIGKTMLNEMAENATDEELKNMFENLNSIRVITTEKKRDSRYYFKKANELIKEAYSDYEEVVSVNERKSKTHVILKKLDDETENLILVSLDDKDKLTILSVSGKVDFKSLAKLSKSLKDEKNVTEDEQPQADD